MSFSTLTVKLNADGTYKGGTFDPPLRPELTSCTGGAFTRPFAPGTSDFTLPVHYGR